MHFLFEIHKAEALQVQLQALAEEEQRLNDELLGSTYSLEV